MESADAQRRATDHHDPDPVKKGGVSRWLFKSPLMRRNVRVVKNAWRSVLFIDSRSGRGNQSR
jgi:hypothetical protein